MIAGRDVSCSIAAGALRRCFGDYHLFNDGMGDHYTTDRHIYYFHGLKVNVYLPSGLLEVVDVGINEAYVPYYDRIKLASVLEYWDKEIELHRITANADIIGIGDDNSVFSSVRAVELVMLCRRAAIDRIKLFTFGDHFISEADRLAVLGELL